MNYLNQFRLGAIGSLLKDWLLMIKHATRSVNFIQAQMYPGISKTKISIISNNEL